MRKQKGYFSLRYTSTERSSIRANLESSKFTQLQRFSSDHIWNKKASVTPPPLPSSWFPRSETLDEWSKYCNNITWLLSCGRRLYCCSSIAFVYVCKKKKTKTIKMSRWQTLFCNTYWPRCNRLKLIELGRRYCAEVLTGIISPIWTFSKVLSDTTAKQQLQNTNLFWS